MNEKGSDELLAELVDEPVDAAVRMDDYLRGEEEKRVIATSPAEHEPGGQYPDPDVTPEGAHAEYDPMPPQEERPDEPTP